MATLFYQAHASWRLTSSEGRVLFIDPYRGDGYLTPADIVLVTHEHYDHNAIEKIVRKKQTIFIHAKQALDGGIYRSFDYFGFHIEAVPAYNSHHKKEETVGYLITVDGITIYHAGDTDLIPEMANLKEKHIDYALLPIDGFYTMGPEDAAKAAEIMDCKHLIPMHMHVGRDFDMEQAMKIHSNRAMLVRLNESVLLKKDN